MNEWLKEQILTFLDPALMIQDYGTPTKTKTFHIKQFDMGRNQKNCHVDTQDDSTITALVCAYHSVKEKEKQIIDSVRANTCTDCCVAIFGIITGMDYWEFHSLLSHLKIDEHLGVPLLYKTRAIKLLQNNRISGEHTMAGACIFVDDSTEECRIYEIRPGTCCTSGTLRSKPLCPKIIADGKTLRKFRDLDRNNNPVVSQIIANNILTFYSGGKEKAMSETFPIVYYFSRRADDSESKIQRMKDALALEFGKPANEFVRIVLAK